MFCAFFRSQPSNKKASIYTSTLFCIALTPLSLFFTPWVYQIPGFEKGVSALQQIEERLNLSSLEREGSESSSPEQPAELLKQSTGLKEVSAILPEPAEPVAPQDTTKYSNPHTVSTTTKSLFPTFPIQILAPLNRWGFSEFRLLIILLWISGVVYFFVQWLDSWRHTRLLLKEAKSVECPDVLDAVERVRQLLFLNADLVVKQSLYPPLLPGSGNRFCFFLPIMWFGLRNWIFAP